LEEAAGGRFRPAALTPRGPLVSLQAGMAAALRNRGSGPSGASPSEQPRVDELLPLARAAASRDPTAAGSLVVHVAPLMLRVVRSVLGARHPDVEDVAQDAVIQLLASLPSFRGESTVLYYAGRIALFTALGSRKRDESRFSRMELGEPSDDLPDHAGPSPLGEAIAQRRRETLFRLLQELPTATAEALALHFVLGYTVEEIAKAANVSVHTVWSRLRLGKEALLRRLGRDGRWTDVERGDG
jgi:RNA polymerase sigma factor (sigma-70 family)